MLRLAITTTSLTFIKLIKGKKMYLKFTILCLTYIFTSAFVYSEVLTTPPDKIDKQVKYFFFSHGSGLYKSYADRAREKWQDKVSALEELGFVMITEEREKGGDEDHALKMAEWIDKLIDKGVPAKNIYVGGYSRGARLSLTVSDILSNKEINYFLLSGCYPNDEFGDDIKGRILSIYDNGDDLFDSCAPYITLNEDITFKEVEVDSGYGHGMGSSVRDEWMDPLLAWLKK